MTRRLFTNRRADLYALADALFRFTARATLIACVVGLGVALAASPALAVGEEITDVRVLGNQRTEESTVRSVAGISIGDTLEMDTLDMVRERLNTTGLFADVNVWWEQHKTGRARQHRGEGQVPLGARADRLVVGQQQVVRPAVRARQPVRARQAAADRRPHRHRRFGRRARLPRSLAASAAGSTGSCRATSSARTSPSTTRTTRARATGPVPRRRCSPPTASSPRSASPGSAG